MGADSQKRHRYSSKTSKASSTRSLARFLANKTFWLVLVVLLLVAAMAGVYWRENRRAVDTGPLGGATGTGMGADPVLKATGNASLARRYVNEGNDLMREGQLAEAIVRYQRAIELQPQDEDAHFSLAIAWARNKEFDKAIQHYTEAIRIMPGYVEAQINLGNLLANLGRLDDAIEHFQAALNTMPQSASAHNNLGTVLIRQGKTEEAIRCFREAVRLMPDYVEAHINLGNSLLSRGQADEGTKHLEEALKLRPGFEPAVLSLRRAQGRTNSPLPLPK
jgi:tetratricopeptide (TPR) repeat protein